MSAEQAERAERLRYRAAVIGELVTDVVAIVVDHADEIAEWSLNRRGRRAAPPRSRAVPRGRSS